MLYMRGLTVADMEKFSYGMLINYCYAYDRQVRRNRGEDVPDPEVQYKKLKKIEPLVEKRYKNGEITKKRYEEFKSKLERWERD